jgi:hypothetical protein
MTSIELTVITGSITIPYSIYACDVYGNNCVIIATIVTTVPPTNTIFLPPQFNTAPAVGSDLKYLIVNPKKKYRLKRRYSNL